MRSPPGTYGLQARFHLHFGAGRLGMGLVVPAISASGIPFGVVQRPKPRWVEMFTQVTLILTLTLTLTLTKVWALGPKTYASDRFNLFDAVITLLGFVQLMVRSKYTHSKVVHTGSVQLVVSS